MPIDISFCQEVYFTFDKVVPYKLKCGDIIKIKPVTLSDSLLFITSYGVLDIDKNSTNDVDVISMSYLKFLAKRVLPFSESSKQQFVNICLLCLGFDCPYFTFDEKDRPYLCNIDQNTGKEILRINQKEFDSIYEDCQELLRLIVASTKTLQGKN